MPPKFRVYIYNQKEPVELSFLGNLKPNGFLDFRIFTLWLNDTMPNNTGWSKI
jgi:hypothetical protein